MQRVITALAGVCLFSVVSVTPSEAAVTVTPDGLEIAGQPAPFLYGAEVQYFRARGGPARNVAPETVEALWNKLVDRVLEARMNTVIFYIPWDFHEPAEGVFDFDGTLDRDGDGRPDYPSRNLRGFLRLLQKRGIRNVMIRPGPYINAEWGPEGFGAVPRWFLDHHPSGLQVSQAPGKPRVAAFNHPEYRKYAERWLRTLHAQVLKEFMGPGSNIHFVQLDNETNYFWDSIYERDWSEDALARYRRFVGIVHNGDLAKVNAAYRSTLTSLQELRPPKNPGDLTLAGPAWHFDWFHFHDMEILEYYRFLKQTWEDLGVREPQVLFTSCDSFNVVNYALLPRLDYRQGSRLSLTTMNVYPKTFGDAATSTLNTPMKAAHDSTLIAAAHGAYYGGAADWVMTTETVGGWFPPTQVTLGARQHTYGSLLGSGTKAMVIYYFHEGWNWTGLEGTDTELRFDAPLDKDLEPRPAFALLKELGRSLEGGLGALVAGSWPMRSRVLLAHDSMGQYPIPGKVNALEAASTDAAATFGWLREAGVEPQIAFLDAIAPAPLQQYPLVVWRDRGYLSPPAHAKLTRYVKQGGTLLLLGASTFPMPPDSLGKVIALAANPADGWNDDRYLKLADALPRLAQAKAALAAAGIAPQTTAVAADGRPFLHAWWRRAGDRYLLFVENFAREPRRATITPEPTLLGKARRFDLVRRLAADAGAGAKTLSWDRDTSAGLELVVGADGIDVWEVVPR